MEADNGNEGDDMKRGSIPMLVCLFSMVVVGCVAPRFIPVADVTQRLDFHGFSILPPQGKDWYVVEKDPRAVAFRKKLMERPRQPEDLNHTFAALAGAVDLKQPTFDSPTELREFVERSLQGEGRFSLIESRVVLDGSLGFDCMRYDAIQEERGNPRAAGFVLVITMHGLFCPHPYAPGLIVHVHYSERRVQGDRALFDEALRREVEPFLRSVVFTRLR